MLKPTVKPIPTDMSCNAVLNPLMYASDVPEVCCDAKASRPVGPNPDGSWNIIPVI